MGAVCSIEERDDSAGEAQQKQLEGKSVAASSVHPSHVHHASHSTAAPSLFAKPRGARDDDLPRDVVMQRLWTSVVVGELVKHHTISLYDESWSVLAVVQAMMKSGANYAIIRKTPAADAPSAASASTQPPSTANALATSAASGVQRTFRGGRRQRDSYIGLFDWRDLNALIVAVCKLNRLHAQQPSATATAAGTAATTPLLKIRHNSSMASLNEEELGDDESNRLQPAGGRSSSIESTDTPNSQPRQLLDALAPGVVSLSPSQTTRSPASAANKRAIQLTTTDPFLNQPLLSPNRSSASVPAASIPPPLSVASPSAAAAAANPSLASASSTSTLSSSDDSALSPYLHFLDMKRAPVQLIANLSARNPMQVVNTACPLLGGAKLLVGLIGHNQATAEGANGGRKGPSRLWEKKGNKAPAADSGESKQELYRLTVLNKDGVFVGCMTQLALCHFVKDKLDTLGALADEPLQELGLGRTKRVLTISWKSPVLTALLLMHDKKLSALAIVNDGNGRLVGTISCSDVKYLFLAPELLLTLQRPVSVFVAALRQSATHWHVNLTANSPPTAVSANVTVTPKSTLRAAVELLLQTKVRRAWVVNESEQPIGMVSISDVVKFALPTAAPQSAPTPAHTRH